MSIREEKLISICHWKIVKIYKKSSGMESLIHSCRQLQASIERNILNTKKNYCKKMKRKNKRKKKQVGQF